MDIAVDIFPKKMSFILISYIYIAIVIFTFCISIYLIILVIKALKIYIKNNENKDNNSY